MGITLLAVGWLAIWSVKDHSKPSKTWWPFSMRGETDAPNAVPDARPTSRRTSIVPRRADERPWRRSGS
jgi:hypothetical protein